MESAYKSPFKSYNFVRTYSTSRYSRERSMTAKHYKYKKPGAPFKIFPNLLMSEMQFDGPLQCIVSDMTAFWVKGIYYELTLYMDLWNNEILSHSLSSKRGD